MESANIEYRNIEEKELTCELFAYFDRHQVVTKCFRNPKVV